MIRQVTRRSIIFLLAFSIFSFGFAGDGDYFSYRIGSKVPDQAINISAKNELEFKKQLLNHFPRKTALFRELVMDVFAWSNGASVFHLSASKADLIFVSDPDLQIIQIAAFTQFDSLDLAKKSFVIQRDRFLKRFSNVHLEVSKDEISREVLLVNKKHPSFNRSQDLLASKEIDRCLETVPALRLVPSQFCVESVRVKGFVHPGREKFAVLLHAVAFPMQFESQDLDKAPIESDNQGLGLLAIEKNLQCLADIAYTVEMDRNSKSDQGYSLMIPIDSIQATINNLKLIFTQQPQLPEMCLQPKLNLYLQLNYSDLNLEKLRQVNSKYQVSDMILNPSFPYSNFELRGAYNYHYIKKEYQAIEGVILLGLHQTQGLNETKVSYDSINKRYRFTYPSNSQCNEDCPTQITREFQILDGVVKEILK